MKTEITEIKDFDSFEEAVSYVRKSFNAQRGSLIFFKNFISRDYTEFDVREHFPEGGYGEVIHTFKVWNEDEDDNWNASDSEEEISTCKKRRQRRQRDKFNQ